MRFSKNKRVCPLGVLLLLSLFFFFCKEEKPAAASSSYVTCSEEGGYFIIAPPRDCDGKANAGAFTFNVDTLSNCQIKQGSRGASEALGMKSDMMEAVLSIPLENFVKLPGPIKGVVAIEITAPVVKNDLRTCGSQRLNALIARNLLSAEKEKIQPVTLSDDVYKLAGLQRNTQHYAIVQNGQWALFPMTQDVSQPGFYDLYYQKKRHGRYQVSGDMP